MELSNPKNKNFKKECSSSKNKKSHSEKMFYISGNETLKRKLKKLGTFQERTLKVQAKKISYFLRVSKSKFIHSSS